jgi:hypothetical protein
MQQYAHSIGHCQDEKTGPDPDFHEGNQAQAPFFMRVLEEYLETKLELAGSATSQRRIVVRDVRRGLGSTEAAWRREWCISTRAIELWAAVQSLVEKVEDFGAKLAPYLLTESPVFQDGSIPGVESISAECIASHRAGAANCRRNHHRVATHETSPLLK